VILYIGRRLFRGVLTIFGVVTISFVILRLQGSPAYAMLPNGTPDDIAALDRALGFDNSLLSQYWHFLGNVLHFDLGTSLQEQGTPALDVVMSRMPATLELAVSAFLLGALLGLLLGLLVQLTRSPRLRNAMIWLGVARQASPTFLFGVILVIIFSVRLGWLPSIGRGGLSHLVLPVTTLATFEITLYMRLIASSLGEQEELDYVRTAYSKGQRRSRVIWRHMLPNALLPALTVAGLNFGALLGGAVIVENVFNWPGVGHLMVQSVALRDYPVIQATLIVVAMSFVLVNIGVDLLYAVLDPRVRLA
jgi:peptide/nickel transport system permease protein